MLPSLALWILLIYITNVVGANYKHHPPVTSVSRRLTSTQTDSSCAALCRDFLAFKAQCNTPHCGCTIQYVRMQGECLVCGLSTPQSVANVQLFLDDEMNQCHSEGISIKFRLPLPPDAAAIVEETDRRSNVLRHQQTAFLILQIAGGHVGLVITLLFATFSTKIHRGPAFFNFCVTWVFSSFIYCVMLYRGTNGHTILNPLGQVSPAECLTQAVLTNGAQVMTACSTMMLVMQLWLCLRSSLYGTSTYGSEGGGFFFDLSMVSPPYILFSIFAVITLLIGNQHILNADGGTAEFVVTKFYCTIFHQAFVRTVYGVTLGFLIVTLILDVLIVRIIFTHWKFFRCIQNKYQNVVSLSLVLRLIGFSMYRIVTAIACVAVLKNPIHTIKNNMGGFGSLHFAVPTWVDILQASVPLVGFLVLGVTRDMVSAITFFAKKRSPQHDIKQHKRSLSEAGAV